MSETFKNDIESGKVLAISLVHFYLNQEHLIGGVSEEDMKKAQQVFDDIIASARQYMAEGKSRDEVLGWVLKQQGKGREDSALLTDLLLKHEGNCEAREKFISAVFQVLYPEEVAAGNLRTESFGAYVDENGELQPPHIRIIVVRENGVIDVLEGAGVKHENIDDHKDIPNIETTQMSVKAFAAKEHLFSFDENQFISQERERLGTTPVTGTQALSLPSSNSTMEYPASAARYVGGTYDVVSEKFQGSWAYDPEDWKGTIELELREKKPVFDMAAFQRLTTSNLAKGFDLYDYGDIEPVAFTALIEFIKRNVDSDSRRFSPLIFRGNQKIPAEAFKNFPGGADIEITGVFHEKNLRDIPIRSLKIDHVKKSLDLRSLTVVKDWKLSMHLDKDFVSSVVWTTGNQSDILLPIHDHGPSYVQIEADPDITNNIFFVPYGGSQSPHTIHDVVFYYLLPYGLTGFTIDHLTIMPGKNSSITVGLWKEMPNVTVRLHDAEGYVYDNDTFTGFWLSINGRNDQTVSVDAAIIGKSAFADVILQTVFTNAIEIRQDAFKNLHAKDVVFYGGLPVLDPTITTFSGAQIEYIVFKDTTLVIDDDLKGKIRALKNAGQLPDVPVYLLPPIFNWDEAQAAANTPEKLIRIRE